MITASIFPPRRAADPGQAARRDEPAGRHAQMSKSDPSDQSRINLTDGADVLAQKNPARQNRPIAATPPPKPNWPSVRKRAICWRFFRPCPVRAYRRCWAASAAAASARSRKAWQGCWWSIWRRSRPRRRGCWPTRRTSITCWKPARRAPMAVAEPIVREAERLVGLRG